MKPHRTRLAMLFRGIVLLAGLWFLAPVLGEGTSWPPRASIAAAVTPESRALDLSALDALIVSEMAATRLPGLAVGVVQDDRIVHLRGFGRADTTGRAVTAQTPFLIASVTKSLTAIAIMQLVEAGRLQLDAPVQRYLPWFQVADTEATGRITVRQLLSHTSGLPTLTGDEEMIFAQSAGNDPLQMRVEALRHTALHAPPGTRFQYSNAGYATLALLIQTVSGMAYADYVQTHIYGPLAMAHASVARVDAEQQGLAVGHRYLFGRPVAHEWSYTLAELGAGFTYASAEDLAHLLLALLNDGRYGTAQVLAPASLEAMWQPQVSFDSGTAEQAYGLGWFIQDIEGNRIVSHAGVAPNYRAELQLIPQRSLGVVLLMNGESPLVPRIAGLAPRVTGLLLGQELPATVGGAVPAIFRLVLVASGAQLMVLVASLYRLVRQARRRQVHAVRPLGVGLGLLSFILLHLLWGWVSLFLIPSLLMWPLPDLILKLPDLGYTLVVGGVLATGWAFVYPLLAFLLRYRRVRRGLAGSSSAA